MSADSYHKRKVGNRVLQPETQMMGYGFDPALSEGALKPPIFLTSTFVFRNAQDGKDFFDYTSGRRAPPPGKTAGLVYSRFNNPNLEVLEDRLALWEGGEAAAVFSSGMSAISTTLWAFLKPNDFLLMSQPLYGGTETLIDRTLPAFGIGAVAVPDAIIARRRHGGREGRGREGQGARRQGRIAGHRDPRQSHQWPGGPATVARGLGVDRRAAGRSRPPVAVDNTYLGPVYQKPLEHGADLVMYSLTKYVGGHSDLVAGGVVGPQDHGDAGARAAQ